MGSQDTCGHALRHLGGGIANIDLADRDIVLSPVQRRHLCQLHDARLVPVYAIEFGRGAVAEMEPLLMMRPPRGVCP